MANVKVHDKGNVVSGRWDDRKFVAEMNDRLKEYQAGEARLISLEMVEEKARKVARKLKTKMTI